jgi:virginiamycin B lyase
MGAADQFTSARRSRATMMTQAEDAGAPRYHPFVALPREVRVFRMLRLTMASAVSIATWTIGIWIITGGTRPAVAAVTPRPIGELTILAKIRVGKTADWVAITPDAVWVGSTGPYAVHRIDPTTGKRVATVKLDGEPCAGLATGFDSLWVPLCGRRPTLAKVDLRSNRLVSTYNIGPAAAEGGVATSPDSVWLVVDRKGSLARIDPVTGRLRQTIRVPPGSYNPHYSDGRIWVTRAEGAELTGVDAATGRISMTAQTGPGPRFLTAGAGAVWTLNQGDGSLTRIDIDDAHVTRTIALGTPGHGGDIGFGGGEVWTTMPNVPLSAVDAATDSLLCQWTGPGGDSLGIGHGALWLTDYHGGTISRIDLHDALARCNGGSVSGQQPDE